MGVLVFSSELFYFHYFMILLSCFDDYSLVIKFEIRKCDTTKAVLFSQEDIDYPLTIFCGSIKILDIFSIRSTAIGILIEIAFRVDMLIPLIHPIFEHEVSIRVFISSLTSFN